MKDFKVNRLLIAVGIQIAIIFLVIMSKMFILSSGERVLLKIVPVDPRNWSKGDYLVLNFDISTINQHNKDNNVSQGSTIYVNLSKQGEEYRYMDYSLSRPESSKFVFIKGTVKSVYGDNISVSYGIEDYYIPEGRGGEFSGNALQNAYAEVYIDVDGSSVLKDIIIDKKSVSNLLRSPSRFPTRIPLPTNLPFNRRFPTPISSEVGEDQVSQSAKLPNNLNPKLFAVDERFKMLKYIPSGEFVESPRIDTFKVLRGNYYYDIYSIFHCDKRCARLEINGPFSIDKLDMTYSKGLNTIRYNNVIYQGSSTE